MQHHKAGGINMKKILLALCAVMMMVMLAGCPNYVNSIVMTKPPDRLIYIAGQDTELDLTGGELTVYCNGTLLYSAYTLEEEPMKNYYHDIRHDINFSVPGIYVVTVGGGTKQNEDQYGTFEIQVVTQEEYDAMMGLAE
jgi:hypothetical protein